MKPTPILYTMLCALAIAVYASASFWPGQFSSVLEIAFSIVLLGGLYVMLRESKLKGSWHVYPIIAGVVFIFSGFLLGIQHWPGSQALVLAGAATISIFYTLYFSSKEHKTSLDVLKLVWLLIQMTGVILLLFHLPFGRFVAEAARIIMIVMIFAYLYQSTKNEPAQG